MVCDAAQAVPDDRVVLAAAHLDSDPTNNRLTNLCGFRQRRHLLHDRSHHLAHRWITYRRRLAQLARGTAEAAGRFRQESEILQYPFIPQEKFPTVRMGGACPSITCRAATIAQGRFFRPSSLHLVCSFAHRYE